MVSGEKFFGVIADSNGLSAADIYICVGKRLQSNVFTLRSSCYLDYNY